MSVSVWSRKHRCSFMSVVAGVVLISLASGMPIVFAEEARPASTTAITKPMNIDVKGGSIVDTLTMLSRRSNIDIVTGPDVKGEIPSLKLRDKTLEQVLWLIAQSGGYRAFKIDSVTYLISSSTPQTDFLSELGFGQAAPPPPPELALISVKVLLLDKPDIITEQEHYVAKQDPTTAEGIIYDSNAGLTTYVTANGWRVRAFFPQTIGPQRGSANRQKTILQAGEEESFEFIWPEGRPHYYLEEVEKDLYKRVELADKEGYTVSVRPTGEPPEFTVHVELTRKALSGGTYDETIRAFVGRPTLTKTTVTRTVPLSSGQPTLLVWQPQAETPPGPAGVAVLLEVKSPEEAVAVGAETEVATEPTSEAEPQLWTEIPLKYTNPALIAQQFGGQILFTTPDSPEEAAELVRKVTSPPGPLHGHVKPVPRVGGMLLGGKKPLYSGGYGGGFGGGLGTAYGGGGGAGAMGMMLPEGMDPPVAVMERNVLLVHGTQEAIDQFREILAYLDHPAKQVEITAKFVEVETTEGKPSAIDLFVGDSEGERFGPAGLPGEGITVARFGRDRFQEVLQALLDEGRARIINKPRVSTQNNVPAAVYFSTEIPYFYATITYDQYGQRTVDYESDTVSVGNALYVNPRINEDNTITLDLEAQIEEQVGTVVGPTGETLPIVTTQTVYTQVRVPDGDTVVIGGLTRSDKIFAPGRPSGEEAPIIGEKFRSKLAEQPKKELLIFVTPRILREIPRQPQDQPVDEG